MSRARFTVTQAGPHVSVQDGGRHGLLRFGVPASGPMDRLAFAAANLALGNPADAPGIEISLGGLAMECTEGPVRVAVAGGGFAVEAVTKHGSWRVLTLHTGDRLTIRPGPWGSWTYLAMAGHLQSPAWLGSAATHGSSGLGGGKLAAGDVLTITNTRTNGTDHDVPCPVFARPRHRLRVVLGPQDRYFAPETVSGLLTGRFALTSAYDRMGVRLTGPDLPPQASLTMPSEPIVRGSVQVAGDGVATVLLADHQTTGGYPKIATIVNADLDAFVQLRSRDSVTFQAVSPAQAIDIARTRARAVASYLSGIAGSQ